MKQRKTNWKRNLSLLIFLPTMLLASGCETVLLGKSSFCKKFADDPPVFYYGTDSEQEKREKDVLVAYWLTRCGDVEAIANPPI